MKTQQDLMSIFNESLLDATTKYASSDDITLTDQQYLEVVNLAIDKVKVYTLGVDYESYANPVLEFLLCMQDCITDLSNILIEEYSYPQLAMFDYKVARDVVKGIVEIKYSQSNTTFESLVELENIMNHIENIIINSEETKNKLRQILHISHSDYLIALTDIVNKREGRGLDTLYSTYKMVARELI